MALTTLTDLAARKAKLKDKPYKLAAGGGLFLLVTPDGAKYWRLKYRFAGKEKLLALGVYQQAGGSKPEVGLAEAGELRDAAKKKLAAGIDPGDERRQRKLVRVLSQENSFAAVAREWFDKHAKNWADTHADRIIRRLERDVFPWIGDRPVGEVTAPELLAVIRRIEERGALETAHRALGNCGQVLRYAVATGRAERDPSGDLRGALPPAKETHHAAITEPQQVGELLRAMDGFKGAFVTKCALRLAPLVFTRPGELRKAEWSEIDLEVAQWVIPAERMKMRQAHLVPLSTQAVAILRELHALTGSGRYVFPGARTNGRPMSENAVLAALRRMGYEKDEMTGHGFRAMARTILDEVLGFRPDYIEHQLAHAVRDPNGRAYNRTAHLGERRKMMQAWADYLDKLKAGAEVIPLRGQAA